MGFLAREQINAAGFASVGDNFLLSDKASVYGTDRITIGNNVRIDDYCVISAGRGGIKIGNHVHLAVYSSLIGAGKITLSDYSGLSSRVSIFSSNDDYSGAYMTNPTIPEEYTCVKHADVYLGKHAIIGSGSIILPGVVIEEGAAVGALSLVTKRCKAFSIYMGAPARKISERSKDLLRYEINLHQNQDSYSKLK